MLVSGGDRSAPVSPVGSVGAEQCAKKAMAFCALHPERSGESSHGFAVTEGILTSDSMPLSACDYPFHRLSAVPADCEAVCFPSINKGMQRANEFQFSELLSPLLF